MKEKTYVEIKGHLKAQDDLGKVYVDTTNAIHPQNMARIIARALAHEPNAYIWRIAYGNGGTEVTAANQIEYKTPNDGQSPDENTWNSRIYNEVYSEIIDDGLEVLNPDLGADPGHADVTGQRSGGGAAPEYDPATVPHVYGPGVRSNELGLTSEVVITSVLNQNEPKGQNSNDLAVGTQAFESSFVFDEIGLYSGGAVAAASSGYQNIDVDNKTSDDVTPLDSRQYGFNIVANGGTPVKITFTPPVTGGSGPAGEITYGDLCQAINENDPSWSFTGQLPVGVVMWITDAGTGSYPSIDNAQTYGYLQFKSSDTGSTSTVSVTSLVEAGSDDLWDSLGATILSAVDGSEAGVQNDPINHESERERLMTHLVFAPVMKAENRSLTITYTLTISVARTEE